MPQVDGFKAYQVVPSRKVIVPDDGRCRSCLTVEHLHVAVRFAEIVPPQPRSSDHCYVHSGHAIFCRAAVGVDQAVPLAATGTVPVLATGLTSGWAA